MLNTIDCEPFTPGVITGLTNHFTSLKKREEMLSIQTDETKAQFHVNVRKRITSACTPAISLI